MKIATLTLNPAIDRTFYCGEVKTGALNRAISPSVTTHGGKGTNVSCALKQLGVKSTAYGFYGGDTGDLYMKLLEPYRSDIDINFTKIKSGTRINFKIIAQNGESTEFNEAGGFVEPHEKDELLDKIKRDLDDIDIFIMSGSVPPGIEKSIYRDVINLGGDKTKFILDCDGEALKLCMANKKKPYIIKPNLFELEQFTGKKFDLSNDSGEREIFDEVAKIREETGVIVLCTLGEHGAVINGGGGTYCVSAPKLEKGEVRGFAGAGDTFLAAFCAAYFGLFDFEEIWRAAGGLTPSGRNITDKTVRAAIFANIAAAAKVTKPGTEFPSAGEIREMCGRMMNR